MAYQLPTKKQRDVMLDRLTNPHLITQAQVIKQLKLSDCNAYYRLFERSIIAARKEMIRNGDELILKK